MPASNNADASMRKNLVLAANVWAERARTKAKTTRIAQMIEVGQVQSLGSGRWQIEIVNKAPEAAAYEFGSGLHRTRGEPATYPITPKNARALRFEWEPSNPAGAMASSKVIAKIGSNVWLFRKVDHPGVAPDPHMQPALDEVRNQMSQLIGRSFAVEVVHKSIREAWLGRS